MKSKRLLVCTTLAVVVTHLAATEARGDDTVAPDDIIVQPTPSPETPLAGFLHFVSPFRVKTDGGSELRLLPGYYLDEEKFGRLDGELRRLQEREVRLAAENKSLRSSANGWAPGWKTLASALVIGAAGGWYLSTKI